MIYLSNLVYTKLSLSKSDATTCTKSTSQGNTTKSTFQIGIYWQYQVAFKMTKYNLKNYVLSRLHKKNTKYKIQS